MYAVSLIYLRFLRTQYHHQRNVNFGYNKNKTIETNNDRIEQVFVNLIENAIKEEVGNNFTIINNNFVNIKSSLEELGVSKVDGILYDLGVSSFQLDDRERGFSYLAEEVDLDMRMDQRQTLTAKEIVNQYSERDLFRVIRDYGEDQFAKNIAIYKGGSENELFHPYRPCNRTYKK